MTKKREIASPTGAPAIRSVAPWLYYTAAADWPASRARFIAFTLPLATVSVRIRSPDRFAAADLMNELRNAQSSLFLQSCVKTCLLSSENRLQNVLLPISKMHSGAIFQPAIPKTWQTCFYTTLHFEFWVEPGIESSPFQAAFSLTVDDRSIAIVLAHRLLVDRPQWPSLSHPTTRTIITF